MHKLQGAVEMRQWPMGGNAFQSDGVRWLDTVHSSPSGGCTRLRDPPGTGDDLGLGAKTRAKDARESDGAARYAKGGLARVGGGVQAID